MGKRFKLPEKGLPVNKEGEFVGIPPQMTLEDARNPAQYAEILIRDHGQRRRRRALFKTAVAKDHFLDEE